ncbi:DUF6115 domain-containing protein [Virgibacillus flavescens]|uniref:DUF6115 domain-containing protein n=1 Tax=Virgibacillus flavescens TaxID=1611422 RepID=UPI003D32E786
MTSFLLIISFILHIALFTAIYQLHKQIQRSQQTDNSREMMELFDIYLAEIKDENKRLEETLVSKEIQKDTDEFSAASESAVSFNGEANAEEETYTSPRVDDDVRFETSSQAKILQLHHQGLQSEEIARNLNTGKTEVDLIIKLHAKK